MLWSLSQCLDCWGRGQRTCSFYHPGHTWVSSYLCPKPCQIGSPDLSLCLLWNVGKGWYVVYWRCRPPSSRLAPWMMKWQGLIPAFISFLEVTSGYSHTDQAPPLSLQTFLIHFDSLIPVHHPPAHSVYTTGNSCNEMQVRKDDWGWG